LKGPASGNADAVAAFQFLQRLFTIDTNARGKAEPGLARLQATGGDICRLRCGFHFALTHQVALDMEHEFNLSEIAPARSNGRSRGGAGW